MADLPGAGTVTADATAQPANETIMVFAPVFQRVFPATFSRAAAASAAPWWYVAGKTCVAAYQPKGAASLAASYVNLANPGTYDAVPRVAPTFSAATGWTFNGSTQYLTTGVEPTPGYSIFVRFSGSSVLNFDRCVAGVYKYTAPSGGFCIFTSSSFVDNSIYYYGGNELKKAPRTAAAVLAISGTGVYRDGISEGSVNGTFPAGLSNIYIGALYALYQNGVTAAAFWSGSIQVIAIYSATLTAGEVAAVSAAMAAL